MLPGLRRRKRRRIAGGGYRSQEKVMVGGGVALGFEGQYLYVRYQKLPEGICSRGDLE